jgi:GDP-L-fucose synthase
MHSHINVGTGEDVTIADLARLVGDTVGYRGNISFDTSKPDGTPRKLLDVSKLKQLGWQASMPLPEGLRRAYAAFVELTEDGANRAAA